MKELKYENNKMKLKKREKSGTWEIISVENIKKFIIIISTTIKRPNNLMIFASNYENGLCMELNPPYQSI